MIGDNGCAIGAGTPLALRYAWTNCERPPTQLAVVTVVRLVLYPAALGSVSTGWCQRHDHDVAVVVLAGCPIAVGAVPVAREVGCR